MPIDRQAFDSWLRRRRRPPPGIGDPGTWLKYCEQWSKRLEQYVEATGEHPFEIYWQALETAGVEDLEKFLVEYAVAEFEIRFGTNPSWKNFCSAQIEALDPRLVDQETLRFLDPLLKSAFQGDATADKLLRLIARRIIARNEPLPAPLGDYVSRILCGEGPKANQVRRDTLSRDSHIFEVIQELMEAGCTQSAAIKIVLKALDRLNRKMTEGAVWKIWERRKASLDKQKICLSKDKSKQAV